MKAIHSLSLAVLFAVAAPTFAANDENPNRAGRKEAKKAAQQAAADETNAKLPPDLRRPREGQFEKLRGLIVQGILAGEIDAVEAKALESELSRVERLEYLHKRNGKVSGAERADVNRDLTRLQERIAKKSSDAGKAAK